MAEVGAVAQLGERLVCNQEATGSIPVSSTRFCCWSLADRRWPIPKGELFEINPMLDINLVK
jgi:hypothetical protein